MSLGVADLRRALEELRDRFELDSLAATRKLPDAEPITITVWASGSPTLEGPAGSLVLLDPPRSSDP